MSLPTLLVQTAIDKFGSGDWEGALFDGIVSLIGEGTFGVLIGATMVVSFWIAGDRDLAAPAVLTTLLGAMLFPILPGNFRGIAAGVVFIGLSGAFFAIVRRYAL
jgi:hypothetical protein